MAGEGMSGPRVTTRGFPAGLKRELFPWLGARPVSEITTPELLACLRRIEARGHLENAHRTLTNAGQVFMYAIASGRAERHPAADLRGAIPRPCCGSLLDGLAGPEKYLITQRFY